MVLGNGMIATAFKAVNREDVVYAASGLSNLKGSDPVERQRERQLIEKQIELHADQIFVYISSYSIDDQNPEKNTPYLEHKLHMEKLVEKMAKRYLIIRTSNVVGNSRQPGNLMNFIFVNLINATPFEVWTGTSRNLIDVDDLAKMAAAAIEIGFINKVLYLIHPVDIPIYNIVRHFEDLSGRKANCSLVDKGVHYRADKALSEQLFEKLRLEPNPDLYARGLIHKYFGQKF